MKTLKEALSSENRKKLLDLIDYIDDNDFKRIINVINKDDTILDNILDNINLGKYPDAKKNIKRLLRELIEDNPDFKDVLIDAASGENFKHNGAFTHNDLISSDNIDQFEIYNKYKKEIDEIINYDFKISGSARGKFELFLALFTKDTRFGVAEDADIICTDDGLDKIEVKCVYKDNPALPGSRTAKSLDYVYSYIDVDPKNKIFQNEKTLKYYFDDLQNVEAINIVNGFLYQYNRNEINYVPQDFIKLYEDLIINEDIKGLTNLLGAIQLKSYLYKSSAMIYNKQKGTLLYIKDTGDIIDDIMFIYNNLKFNCPGGPTKDFFKIIDIR